MPKSKRQRKKKGLDSLRRELANKVKAACLESSDGLAIGNGNSFYNCLCNQSGNIIGNITQTWERMPIWRVTSSCVQT